MQAIRSNSAVIAMGEPEAVPDPDSLTPSQLARECQVGSRDAFASLVAQFQERIYSFFLKMTGRSHDAEDLTQETFIKAWQSIGRFDDRFSFATWLFTIARRTGSNHFRSRPPISEPEETPEPSDGSDPSAMLAQDEERRELWRLARTLKPKQYQALWLRYGEGFAVSEIARIMGVHSIHAKVLLHRGRAQLARLLASRPDLRNPENFST